MMCVRVWCEILSLFHAYFVCVLLLYLLPAFNSSFLTRISPSVNQSDACFDITLPTIKNPSPPLRLQVHLHIFSQYFVNLPFIGCADDSTTLCVFV